MKADDTQNTQFLLIAGLARSLVNFRGPLITALLNQGLDVHVAAPDLPANSPTRAQLVALGAQVHEIPLRRAGTNPLADLLTLFALWRLMRRLQPQYVLAYTIKPVVYGTLAAWLARVPQRFALITGLGYAFTAGRQRSRVGRLVQWLYKLALARAEGVFFQNPDDEALFRKLGLLAPGARSCVVNGSGVDVEQYAVAPLPDGGPRFLLIARLLGDKGVREYAQAAARVRAQHPETRFALVGRIDENPDSIAQAELDAWVHDGVVEYLGYLSDVRPAITACSVYVLPSYREGTPRTVLEAMAMGRALITTDAPGCRETVVDGDNGFLVPVRDVDALVDAMLKFVETPELAARMGARSRQIAEERYDVHRVNKRLIGVLLDQAEDQTAGDGRVADAGAGHRRGAASTTTRELDR